LNEQVQIHGGEEEEEVHEFFREKDF